MSQLSNIWKHPRTSAAGILISVATLAGVLAQHGVSLGSVGGGTVVSLAGAVATALLGLMARDPIAPLAQPAPAANCSGNCTGNCSNLPAAPAQSGTTAKLAVWLFIVLLIPLPWLEGCTAGGVANDIVNWTPSLQSAVATVDSTAALLAPADAPIFLAATSGFDVASNLLTAQARAYLANPSSGTLGQLQNQIVTLQQQVNSALLSSARILNPASQQHAMAAIQSVGTIVTAILALVQSVSTKAQVAQMAGRSQIKLSAMQPYLNKPRSTRLIATHYNEPYARAENQLALAEQAEMSAGL